MTTMTSDSDNPCVYLRAGKCVATCDGMCPKLKYEGMVDETCLNPPKQRSPYPNLEEFRKSGRNEVLDKILKDLSGDNPEVSDCDTKDDWYGYGWDDCREHIIEYIKELRKQEGK